MKRSQFITLGIAGISGAVFAPKRVIADVSTDPKAGGVYYTAEAPGRWSEKVGSHSPKISFTKGEDTSVTVKVENAHPQNEFVHYIIKHQLLDSDFNYIDEVLFDPTAGEEPISEFKLEGYQGKLYALSFCNIHDVWLDSVEI